MLHSYLSQGCPRTVTICTEGGEVHVARAFWDLFHGLKVTTEGLGVCSSAGFIMFMAGHERRCLPSTRFFFHRPWLDHPAGTMEIPQIEQHLAELQEEFEWACCALSTKTPHSSTWWHTMGLDKGAWWSAEQAVCDGLVTKIIDR